jgi:2-alkyl-3-oxoalkanoate reductase
MRVFVTGATGALGGHLVPALVAAGHDVTATTRTPAKVAQLRAAGAAPAVVDGLDREAVLAAVQAEDPLDTHPIPSAARTLAAIKYVERMTSVRGCSNEKARKELGWEPRYPSWREGFRAWASA